MRAVSLPQALPPLAAPLAALRRVRAVAGALLRAVAVACNVSDCGCGHHHTHQNTQHITTWLHDTTWGKQADQGAMPLARGHQQAHVACHLPPGKQTAVYAWGMQGAQHTQAQLVSD